MIIYKLRFNLQFDDYDVYKDGVRKVTFDSLSHALEYIKSDIKQTGVEDYDVVCEL